jgi:hypothetical protein
LICLISIKYLSPLFYYSFNFLNPLPAKNILYANSAPSMAIGNEVPLGGDGLKFNAEEARAAKTKGREGWGKG